MKEQNLVPGAGKVTELEGHLMAKGLKVGIVLARFNSFFTQKLLDGAVDSFRRLGGNLDDITVVKVPGGFELPLAAKKLATSRTDLDALVCLGTVIRGGTPHFDYVCQEASKGIAQASLDTGKPISFGVLTLDNLEQGIERAGSKSGNKGDEAMKAAIEMANLFKANF